MRMRTLLAVVLVLVICPPTAIARKWTDPTGTYTVEAEFVAVKDGKVQLRKPDGTIVTVPIERLSEPDQLLVKQTLRTPRQEGDESWHKAYSGNLPLFGLAGEFSGLPSKKELKKALAEGEHSFDLMLSDDMFRFKAADGVRCNQWGTLEANEGTFRTSTVPNVLCKLPKAFDYVKSRYGAPTHTGEFHFQRSDSSGARRPGGVSAVHWYGPVCFILASDGSIEAIGGWPSRIGQQAPEQKSLLPAYDWLLRAGKNSVQIHNPKPVAVTIGIRTKDALGAVVGVDGSIPSSAKGTFSLPPGKYDLFLVYESDPKALYQGDTFELKTKEEFTGTTTTQVEITLAEGGGTYSVRRVK